MDASVRDACASDAAMLNNPGSYGECVQRTTAVMTESIARTCHDRAERAHYTPEQLQAHKEKVKAEEAAKRGDIGVIIRNPVLDEGGRTEPGTPDKPADPKKPDPAAANPPKGPAPPTTASPTPQPPRAGSTETEFDTSEIEAQASADISSCEGSQTSASRCCNNPLSCAGDMGSGDQSSLAGLFNSNSSGGLSEACRNMNSLATNYGNVNSGLAAVCASSHNSCSNTCGGLVDKYADLLASCSDCAARGIYENAHSRLTSRNASCQSLRSRSEQLASTGLSTVNNRTIAEHCTRTASTMPSDNPTVNNNNNRPGSGVPNSWGNSPVTIPPTAADGTRLAAANAAYAQRAGFRAGSQQPKAEDFNVDGSSGYKGYGGNAKPGTQAPVGANGPGGSQLPGGAAGKAAVVANNSGGSIPGSGADFRPASLGPAGNGKPQAGNSKQVTDIDHGFQGGNGFSQPTSYNSAWAPDEPPQQYNGRQIAGNDNQFEGRIDLRQFLPGGSRAAARTIGGNEINKKEENLFRLISNKMNEKCRLGVLWQCQ